MSGCVLTFWLYSAHFSGWISGCVLAWFGDLKFGQLWTKASWPVYEIVRQGQSKTRILAPLVGINVLTGLVDSTHNREVSLYVLSKKTYTMCTYITPYVYVHSKWATWVSLHVVVTHAALRDRNVTNLYISHCICRLASTCSIRIEMMDSKWPIYQTLYN